MVDYFALGLTHALLALAAWRLVQRADLEGDALQLDAGEPEAGEPDRHA